MLTMHFNHQEMPYLWRTTGPIIGLFVLILTHFLCPQECTNSDIFKTFCIVCSQKNTLLTTNETQCVSQPDDKKWFEPMPIRNFNHVAIYQLRRWKVDDLYIPCNETRGHHNLANWKLHNDAHWIWLSVNLASFARPQFAHLTSYFYTSVQDILLPPTTHSREK